MKKIAIILACLFLLGLLGACNQGDNSTSPGASTAPSPSGGQSSSPAASAAPTPEAPVDTGPPPPDMEGYVFRIGDSAKNPWDPDPETETSALADAVRERMRAVEERLNCTIEWVELEPLGIFDTLLAKYMSGDTYVDVFSCTVWNGGKFIKSGILEALSDLPQIDLTGDWWEHSMTETGTFAGKVYMTSPVLNRNFTRSWVFAFNKQIVRDLRLEDPYELWRTGKWTWEKYRELAAQATANLTGGATMGWDDRWGLCPVDPFGDFSVALYQSSGLNMCLSNPDGTITYNMTDPRAVGVLDGMYEILRTDGTAALRSDTDLATIWVRTFVKGNALFYAYMLEGMTALENTHNMEDDWGIIPFPKGAYANDYICGLDHNAKIMGMLSGNPNIDKAAVIFNEIAKESRAETEIYFENMADRIFRDDESLEVARAISGYMKNDPAALYWQAVRVDDIAVLWYSTRQIFSECLMLDNYEPATMIEENKERVAAAIEDFFSR